MNWWSNILRAKTRRCCLMVFVQLVKHSSKFEQKVVFPLCVKPQGWNAQSAAAHQLKTNLETEKGTKRQMCWQNYLQYKDGIDLRSSCLYATFKTGTQI